MEQQPYDSFIHLNLDEGADLRHTGLASATEANYLV